MSFIKRITRANYYRKIFFYNKEDITRLSSILEDNKSVDTLNYLISSYCTRWHSPEYYYRKAASEPCTEHHFVTDNGYEVKGVENPYFLNEIFDLDKYGVFFDGGAYIGDTIETAQKYIPNLRLIYAFEPNKETYKKLIDNKRIKRRGVKFFNNGLGKKEGEFRFKNDGAGFRISEEGSEMIKVLSAGEFVSTLRKDERPDFIKLDIEGAELYLVIETRTGKFLGLAEFSLLKDADAELSVSVAKKYSNDDVIKKRLLDVLSRLINYNNLYDAVYLRNGNKPLEERIRMK